MIPTRMLWERTLLLAERYRCTFLTLIVIIIVIFSLTTPASCKKPSAPVEKAVLNFSGPAQRDEEESDENSPSIRARFPGRLQAPSAQESPQRIEQWTGVSETAHCTLLQPKPGRPKEDEFITHFRLFLSEKQGKRL